MSQKRTVITGLSKWGVTQTSHQTHTAVTAAWPWSLAVGLLSVSEIHPEKLPLRRTCAAGCKLLMTPQKLEKLQPSAAGQLSVQTPWISSGQMSAALILKNSTDNYKPLANDLLENEGSAALGVHRSWTSVQVKACGCPLKGSKVKERKW